MIKRYISKMVSRHGAEGFIIMVLDMIVKITPSKKDDIMVAKIKKAMKAK
tara:strand:+ start:708 stop:857 length:150 start_codon:yes stop_codon:yes gene_type:complete